MGLKEFALINGMNISSNTLSMVLWCLNFTVVTNSRSHYIKIVIVTNRTS